MLSRKGTSSTPFGPVNQAHKQLSDEGTDPIKEGDFVNTFECISHDNMLGEGSIPKHFPYSELC